MVVYCYAGLVRRLVFVLLWCCLCSFNCDVCVVVVLCVVGVAVCGSLCCVWVCGGRATCCCSV